MTKLSILEHSYPGLKDSMYQVSCEEEIDQINDYCSSSTPPVTSCEKEHVLVCIRIRIDDRLGVLLLDSGYHVAQPITVMEDSCFPHTGQFMISRKGPITKYYSYRFHSNAAFVVWNVQEYKAENLISNHFSCIHISRPFLSAVDIAERRNLVYPFKSLLSRDENGKLIAGLFFPIKAFNNIKITFFYFDELNERIETKIPLTFFHRNSNTETHLHKAYNDVLESIHEQFSKKINVRNILCVVANLLADASLLHQLILLNEEVDKISIDN